MSRTMSRGPILWFLAVALLFWSGCSDDLTGPSSSAVDYLGEARAAALSTGETYTIEDLGTLGGAWSQAYGVNANGWVVGVSLTSDAKQHAFLWTPEDGMMDISTSEWTFSRAEAVNDYGMVVGWGTTTGGIRAWKWTAETGIVSMGAPSGHSSSYAFNVNDVGEIVGMALDSYGVWHAIVWTSPTNLTVLGSLGGSASRALDINEDGRVAGKSTTSASLSRAVVWVPLNPIINLGTLGGAYSEALGINDLNQVVGWANDASQRARPFLWPVGGEMTDLGTLGGDDGEAWEINDGGFIVGDSEVMPGAIDRHATLWTTNGEVLDLGVLTNSGESFARDINATGTIVGFATTALGDHHAVRWVRGEGGTPPSVAEIMVDLEALVRELRDYGNLNRGNGNALLSKIYSATGMINDGKLKPAANILGAFINQVDALEKSRRLSAEEAAELRDLANAAIALLEAETT